MSRIACIVFFALLIVPCISNAETIDVQINGFDDGQKTTEQRDYKEAVLFAKREAVERAGVQIKSITNVRDLVVNSDYIESKAEAVLLPGYRIMDIGYQQDGTYLVILIGKVKTISKYVSRLESVVAEREAEQRRIVTTRTVPTLVSWRAPRKTRILSVGIGNSKDSAIPKIDYAESDARGFASLIRSSGIPEENISYLTNKDACRNDITDALIKLKMATTERSETAIFYFSGHGAPLIKNGKIVDAALVPYDARENTLEYTGIKISTLRELLSETRGN